MMVLGCEVSGRYLGYEGGAIMNGISVLIRGPTEIPCHFYHFTLIKLARRLKNANARKDRDAATGTLMHAGRAEPGAGLLGTFLSY